MKTVDIVGLCIAGVLFLALLTISIVRFYKQKAIREEEKSREVEDVVVKRGVRYTEDETVVTKGGDMNVSYAKGDVVLKQNQVYVADPKGVVKPGKYVVLSPSGNEETFNIRIGKYVKNYKHNQKIVIADGVEISSVSSNVILR